MKIIRNPDFASYTVEGKRLPGVTSIIKTVYNEQQWGTEAAKTRGIAVHQATRFYDEDGPGFEQNLTAPIDESIRPYVDAWIRFRKDKNFQPEAIEMSMAVPRLNYAGTVDRFGKLDGKNALIDIKTGTPTIWTALQTIAYAHPLAEPCARVIVQLKETGRYNLIDHPILEWRPDWDMWLTTLKAYRWILQKRGETR